MTEDRDTDPAPFPPEEEMPKLDRSTMTTDDKLNAILDRLEEGDERFSRLDADWTIAMNFLHEVAVERGRDDIAKRINETMTERRPPNGSWQDEKTNPGDG